MDNINTESSKDYSEYKIPHPVKYDRNDNILIFPGSTFDQISTLDCNDTVDGNCINNISFDECITKCTDNPDKCAVGYYIKTPISKICVPIDVNTLKQSNPVYKLRRKDMYQELEKSEVTSFIDTRTYPFPPNVANNVFLLDVTQLVTLKSGLSLGKEGEDPPIADFEDKTTGVNVQLLPLEFSNTLSSRYIPVKYNDSVFLRVPFTNYILSMLDFGNSFDWEINQLSTASSADAFKIIKVGGGSTDNEILTYGDEFRLKYGDIYFCAVDKNRLISSQFNFEQLESRGYETIFIFKPKMLGYYCEDGECKSIELDKTETDGPKATYKGREIFVNPVCYNLCDLQEDNIIDLGNIQTYDTGGTSVWIWIAIFVPIGVLLLLILGFFYVRWNFFR